MHDPSLPPSRSSGGPPYEVTEHDPRIDQLAREIAHRLRPLYENMPEPDFRTLTRTLARTKLRWG